MTIVAGCTCPHAGQDSIHGPGRRVFNRSGKPIGPFKCTVCSAKLYITGKGVK